MITDQFAIYVSEVNVKVLLNNEGYVWRCTSITCESKKLGLRGPWRWNR